MIDEDRSKRFLRGSFATWKFRVLDAIQQDPRTQPSDFSVAFALMQTINQATMTGYPSQSFLARRSNMSRRYVVRCLNRLRDAGWVTWTRGNRQRANEYTFNKQTIADALARADNHAPDEPDEAGSDVNSSSHQKAVPSGTMVPLGSGTGVPTNTYRGQTAANGGFS